MGKWGNESAALVGFEITVPAPVPDEREQQASEQGPAEDTWYRTLRVMSGSPEAAGVERTGALGESPRPQSEANAEVEAAAKQQLPPTSLGRPTAMPSQPASQDAPEAEYVAPQKSADSYEDNWYQILRSRQAAGED
jgi:hypothetical protein